MPVNTPLSPRVRAVSNERVDLPDFNRLQDMVDQTVRRNMGGLMGYGSGLLTPFVATYDAGAFTVTFGPFQYLLSEPNNNMRDVGTSAVKAFRGGVYDFVPNAASQTATWSLAAARAKAVAPAPAPNADAYPFVFVRPQQVQTDTESRVAWVAGVETPVSIKTQLDLRHEFLFSATAPADTEGWACIGKLVSWSNVATPGAAPSVGPPPDPGTPTIVPIAAWDSREVDAGNNNGTGIDWYSSLGVSNQKLLEVSGGAAPFTGTDYAERPFYKDFGLLQLLGFMRGQIQRVIDSDKVLAWTTNPNGVGIPGFGLYSLSGGLEQLWAKVAPLWQRYNVDQTVLPWAGGRVLWTPGPNTYTAVVQGNTNGALRHVVSLTPYLINPGCLITLDPPPAGWRYTHVVASSGSNTWLTVPGDNRQLLPNAYIIDAWSTPKVVVSFRAMDFTLNGLHDVTTWSMRSVDESFTFTVFITKDV